MSAPSPKSRLGSKLLLLAAGLVLLALLATYLLRPTAHVATVARGRAVDAKPGSVTVDRELRAGPIKAEAGGMVMKSALEPGKPFKEGEFMAQIDPGDIDLEIEHAQNDLEALKARQIAVGSQNQLELETAKADLEVQEHLYKLGQVADVDIRAKRRTVEAIQQRLALENVNNDSKLEAYRIAIEQKKLLRDRMTINAPFDGVVAAVLARTGALIPAGEAVAHFITTSRTVEARISEENFAGIAVGDKATVNFLGYNDKLFDATVTKVLPTAEAATQRYVVYLDVTIPIERLTPGLTGEVIIIVDSHSDVLLVPRRALLGNTLLVVNGGHVEVRTVKHGFMGVNVVEITDGVQEGDQVIVQDVEGFSPGERVRTVTVPH